MQSWQHYSSPLLHSSSSFSSPWTTVKRSSGCGRFCSLLPAEDCLEMPSSTLYPMPSWLREVVGRMVDTDIATSNIMATATEGKVDMTLMTCLLGLEFLVASWPFSVLRSLSGS